ncbi:MAG: DMT family transporter [Humidesulfovibrio sp.]|uniref:DMT family transporter n=1 Tax=Humidesulfovibrio sp. TaxID=2910988 RepID=UPI0027ED6EE1|nr:DMT family transporter [Humidesulfovibrio sp.]MDQ7836006.1 DMT family transporter [Humidesulfovibrio sp.]
MKEGTKATLALVATALIWSSGGLAVKLVDVSPMAITGVRGAISALTILLMMRGALDLRPTRARLGTALCYAGLLLGYVVAMKMTTAANAILLAYTAPMYVALLAPRLLGEPTRPRDWLFVLTMLCGMVLFFLDRVSTTGLWGNVIAMGTGMLYAAFTLCMRAQKDASPLEAVALGNIITALIGLPFLLWEGLPDASGWLGLVYLGVVQQGLSMGLYVWAIKRLGALEAILIMTLEPILNPVWVALGYGEIPGLWSILGGAVVLCAVTLRGVSGALRKPAPASAPA